MLIISLIIYSRLQYGVYVYTFIFLNLFIRDFILFLNFSVEPDGFETFVEFSLNVFSVIMR